MARQGSFSHRYPPKYIFMWLAFMAAAGFLLYAILANAATDARSDNSVHTECQYPLRPLTSAGTCDNSDPADPAATVKEGAR